MKTMQEVGPNNAVHGTSASTSIEHLVGATDSLFKRVWNFGKYHFKVWCDRKKLYMELMAMDERELSHIGLTRNMIAEFTRDAFRRS